MDVTGPAVGVASLPMGTRARRWLFRAKMGPWTLKVPTQASLGHKAAGPLMLRDSAHSPQAVCLGSCGIEESCTPLFLPNNTVSTQPVRAAGWLL